VKLIHALVFMLFVVSPQWALGSAGGATFQGSFVDGSVGNDYVHWSPTTSQLLVCPGSDAAACRVARVRAQHVLPIRKAGRTTELLLADGANRLEACRVGVRAASVELTCRETSVGAIAGSATRLSTQQVIHLSFGNGVDCAYTSQTGVRCSSARQFLRRSGSNLLFGRFVAGAESLQVLELNGDSARVCAPGGDCRNAVGLDLLSLADRLHAGTFSRDGAPSVLIGVGSRGLLACSAYGADTSRVNFQCRTASPSSDVNLWRPYVVEARATSRVDTRSRGTVVFVPDRVARAQSGAAFDASDSEKSLIAADAAAIRTLIREVRPATPLARTAGDSPISTASLIGPDEDFDDDFGIPNMFEVYDTYDGWGVSMWSDTMGYLFKPEDRPWDLPRPQCRLVCEQEYQDRSAMCEELADAVAQLGVAVTVGATIGTAISGPGALGVFSGGIAATAVASDLTSTFCKGGAAKKRRQCMVVCDSLPQ
jgi:hypothetical protein